MVKHQENSIIAQKESTYKQNTVSIIILKKASAKPQRTRVLHKNSAVR